MLKQISLAQAKRTKRDRFFIISAMLSHAGRGACKTHLMNRVGLSSSQVEAYLQVLLQSELLEVSNCRRKSLYRTTEKGKNFLCVFDALISLLDDAHNVLPSAESERLLLCVDNKLKVSISGMASV
jgi:predicted transcriptional regulator